MGDESRRRQEPAIQTLSVETFRVANLGNRYAMEGDTVNSFDLGKFE